MNNSERYFDLQRRYDSLHREHTIAMELLRQAVELRECTVGPLPWEWVEQARALLAGPAERSGE